MPRSSSVSRLSNVGMQLADVTTRPVMERLQLQPCGQFGKRCGQQPLYKGEKRQNPGKKRADTAYDR